MTALIRQWGRNWHVRHDGESTTTGSFMGCVEWACGALEPGGPPISIQWGLPIPEDQAP